LDLIKKRGYKMANKNGSTLGTKWMHKGNKHKCVNSKDIDDYLNIGWSIGMSKKRKKDISKRQKTTNKKWIHNENEETQVSSENINEYLNLGYSLGRLPFTKTCKKNMKTGATGSSWMNNGNKEKKVSSKNIDDFINNGWNFGRLEFSKLAKKNMGTVHKGRIGIYKKNKIKHVYLEDFKKIWKFKGWKKGLPLKQRREIAKNTRLQNIKRIEECKLNGNPIYPCYNKSGCRIIDWINDAYNLNCIHAETLRNNKSQKGEIRLSIGFWLDGYDKEKNVVVEINERHHYDENGNNTEKDVLRRKDIMKFLGPTCTFIEVKVDGNNNIELISIFSSSIELLKLFSLIVLWFVTKFSSSIISSSIE